MKLKLILSMALALIIQSMAFAKLENMNGKFLEYHIKAIGDTEEKAVRFQFTDKNKDQYSISISPEFDQEFYEDSYGSPIIVDDGFKSSQGIDFQFGPGTCPFFLSPVYRQDKAQLRWTFDGAGVGEDDPEAPYQVPGVVTGPQTWEKWNVWQLEVGLDNPNKELRALCYYEKESGIIVGIRNAPLNVILTNTNFERFGK